MNKNICIIAANCQGAYLKALLSNSPEFDARYEVSYFVNYNHKTVPIPLLKQCKLLIYQPLGPKWGDLATPKLLNRVGPDCTSISVNYLTFPVYWPFMAADSRNSPDTDYPFGQFPYGDSLVIEMLQNPTPPDEILARYLDRKFMGSRISPDAILESYVEKQRDLEERRDQKVLDYVVANFRNIKLFETFNHPSKPLCIYQANDILARLGMAPLNLETIPDLPYLQDNQQPIHPMVAEAFGLRFGCGTGTRYNIWKKPMTFIDYSKAYIEWDLTAIGKQITMGPKQVPLPDPLQSSTDPSMNQEQLIFLHIPKTAGSSLNKMLSEAYGVEDQYVHYNSTLNLIKDPKRRHRPLILGHIHYDSLQVLSTNRKVITFLREPVARTISAFEFMKSHPETWLGKLAQGSITEFLTHPAVIRSIRDLQTRLLGLKLEFKKLYADLVAGRIDKPHYFARIQAMAQDAVDQESLETAKERLKTLDFVGFTDTFDDDARALFAQLGKPCHQVARTNQTIAKFKKRDQYTEEEITLVRSLNSLDIQLYDFAKELRRSRNGHNPIS